MTTITTAPSRRTDGRRAARTFAALALFFCFVVAAISPAGATSVYPAQTDYIADDAAVLSESTVREIKEKNEALISDVEAVIAVCTVKSTNGVDIGKYARSVYTEWKLPAGVLILIASEDNAFFLVQSASISDKITVHGATITLSSGISKRISPPDRSTAPSAKQSRSSPSSC